MVTAADIDAVLPQTQCTRCGYAGCMPYAEAIAANEAPINRCPPGGESVLHQLSRLTQQPITPIDPHCGTIGGPKVAVIDADRCIGCAKCLPACPVDAILGARKSLHRVINTECSGCELCLSPCPVDCIEMRVINSEPLPAEQLAADADRYRIRYQAHRARAKARQEAKLSRFNRLTVTKGDPS